MGVFGSITAKADNKGNITITIPGKMLEHYVSVADTFEDRATVSDLPLFAKDFANTLINDEEEDGTNHIHRAMDSAFERYSEGHADSEGLKWG